MKRNRGESDKKLKKKSDAAKRFIEDEVEVASSVEESDNDDEREIKGG